MVALRSLLDEKRNTMTKRLKNWNTTAHYRLEQLYKSRSQLVLLLKRETWTFPKQRSNCTFQERGRAS